MNVSTKRASIGVASTLVAAGLVVGGVVTSSDAATTATATTKTVNISGSMFMPSTVKIKAGTKVKWVNKDFQPHSVTWNSTKYGLKSDQLLNPGGSFTVTFPKAGTFAYHCRFHPGMTGKVVVTK